MSGTTSTGRLGLVGQGEIWLLEQPNDKSRPALVLTRNSALRTIEKVTVAPLTRTQRGIPTEVTIGRADHMPVDSVATFDNVTTVRRGYLTTRLGELAPGRWHEVCTAWRAAIDC